MDSRVGAPAPDIRILSLALTAGVLAVYIGGRLPPFWLLAGLGLAAVVWPWPGRPYLMMAVLGLLLAAWQAQTRVEQRWPPARHGEEIEVRGRVASVPERSLREVRGEAETTLRFEFEPERVDERLPVRIRVSWYRADRILRGGECWMLRLRMRTPHGSLNPDGFDYEAWLFRRGITATATVREAQPCGAAAGSLVLRGRQALLDRIEAWLGTHPARAMVAALVLGEDSGFRDADWEVFRETGTSHLVAISGFNVAIVAAVVFFFTRWLAAGSMRLTLWLPAQKVGLIAAALAGLGYGLLAGWESPAQRAALMLALLLIAALPDRSGQPSRVLALTWLLMLAFDPASVLSPGLWLSFAAVAAIFALTTGRLRPARAWQAAVAVQLMLSLVLAPLTLWFFHGASWPGPVVNLLAVPAMALLTPLLLLAVVLALVVPAIGVPALQGLADVLGGFQWVLAWVAAQVPAPWIAASPPPSVILLALFGAMLLWVPRGLPLRPLGLVCLLPLLFPERAPVAAPFELTALDVGQGLAVVVRTAHHTLLYDAGPAFEDGFDAGESVVAPYLLGRGDRTVHRLLLSHGDSDHAGGVPGVRKRVRVADELGTPGHPSCREGRSWDWDGVHFEVLHPDTGKWSDNDSSCVLRISAPGLSALLAGDVERAAESRMLEVHRDRLAADLLVAPHHGSKTSSTEAFVAAVAPRQVVFAAGWRSHFRHPRPEVVARYEAIGAHTLTTGVEGAVSLWLDPNGGLSRSSWRREHAAFWNAAAEP